MSLIKIRLKIAKQAQEKRQEDHAAIEKARQRRVKAQQDKKEKK